MTKVFSKNNNDFYDDYAHHPTEIKSILEAVKNVNGDKKIISVFEPHRYSRVLTLKKEFAKSFVHSNLVLLCPLYTAGEKRNLKYNNYDFAKLIAKHSKTQVIIINSYNDIENFFKKNLTNNEIIIGMGAGAISKYIQELKKAL